MRQRLSPSGHPGHRPAVPGRQRHVRKTGGAGEVSTHDATHLGLMRSRRVLSRVNLRLLLLFLLERKEEREGKRHR